MLLNKMMYATTTSTLCVLGGVLCILEPAGREGEMSELHVRDNSGAWRVNANFVFNEKLPPRPLSRTGREVCISRSPILE